MVGLTDTMAEGLSVQAKSARGSQQPSLVAWEPYKAKLISEFRCLQGAADFQCCIFCPAMASVADSHKTLLIVTLLWQYYLDN